jgi:hypothetical protein
MTPQQADLIIAVLYAIDEGCFFPVPEPNRDAGVRAWVQWGAMRNLHRAIADLRHAGQADRREYQLTAEGAL